MADTFLSSLWKRPKPTLMHQLLEPMQCFLGDPESGKLNLETSLPHTSHCKEDTG